MLEKIIRFFDKHPIIFFICMFLGLIVVPTAIIHVIYIIPTESWWSQEKISAGSMLSYIGTVLTFCATFMLSMTVYISNKKQSEQLQIAENRTIVTIDNNEKVYISLLYEDPVSISIDINLNVLSVAKISEMNMSRLTVEDRRIKPDKDKFTQKYEEVKHIEFEYMNNEKISTSFYTDAGIIQKIIEESDDFSVRYDMDVICGNVKTAIWLTLELEPDDKVPNSGKYKIKSSYAKHNQATIC